MKKFLIVSIYLLIIFLLMTYRSSVLNWIQTGDMSIILMFGILLFFGLFPVIPYGVVGGLAGVKFGLFIGSLLNLTASTLAAILMFWVVKKNFIHSSNVENTRLNDFKHLLMENAFLAIVFARMIPIIPAQLVNIVAALVQINSLTFFSATIIGKIPAMFIFAFIGNQLFTNPQNIMTVLLIYLVFIVIVYIVYRDWTRRKRSGDK